MEQMSTYKTWFVRGSHLCIWQHLLGKIHNYNQLCSFSRRDEAVKLLVARGANINQTKTVKQGPQTALDMARHSGYKVTERILRELGAVDVQKRRKQDPTASNTGVQLLIFDDVVPSGYSYPKSYTLSEGSISTHDYSSLLQSQNHLIKSYVELPSHS